MKIDISKVPYKHRSAAASMLMSKGNRLTGLMSLSNEGRNKKQVHSVLQGIFFYDMALSLMKKHDQNFQTLLNWKCQALISIGQYEDARLWYEELVRVAEESEGKTCLGPTAQLAKDQIAVLIGKQNDPLPMVDEQDVRMFDDPPFCSWAEQFCDLLNDRKFKQAHRYLSSELSKTITVERLTAMWLNRVGEASVSAAVSLEQFELSSPSGREGHIGWCYFSVVNEDTNEAISMDVFRGDISVYESGSLDFGRP